MNENYGGDYDYYDYDETSWTEAFCCLKVKEDKGSWETPKKTAKAGEMLEKDQHAASSASQLENDSKNRTLTIEACGLHTNAKRHGGLVPKCSLI